MLTRGNKSATDYIVKSNEYLNQCGAVEFESPEQTLFMFRSSLGDNYCREFIDRGIMTLQQAYQLVTNLDASRGSYFYRIFLPPNKPASSSLSAKPAGPSSIKPTIIVKKIISEPTKANPCP